jgi:hypothetical protein
VVYGSEALEPLISFIGHLDQTEIIKNSPMALTIDHCECIVAAPRRLPTIVTLACDAMEAGAAGTVMSGDYGLAAVWSAIPQGKQLLRIARSDATKRSKEMEYLNDVTAVVQQIEELKTMPAPAPVAERVNLVLKGSAALCQATPKSTSDAGQEYCELARTQVGRLMKSVILYHMTNEVGKWMESALVAYGTTQHMLALPAWEATRLREVHSTRLTHSIPIGDLGEVLQLHTQLAVVVAVINRAAAGSLSAVEAVNSAEGLINFLSDARKTVFTWNETLDTGFSKLVAVLSGLSNDRTSKALLEHKQSLGDLLAEVGQCVKFGLSYLIELRCRTCTAGPPSKRRSDVRWLL